MAYSIYLERASGAPIDLAHWSSVVEATAGLRLCIATTHTVENPVTGAQISRPIRDGDVEIFDPDQQQWVHGFTWFEGRITTGAARDFSDPQSHQRTLLRELAAKLNAKVVGSEGVHYD